MGATEIKPSSKEKILQAALRVIRTQGYSATTVDDLCEAAGVTKGAFFHHFKSKEDLAVGAAKYWSEITNHLFHQAPYQKLADPLERVRGYIDFRKSLIKGKTPEFTCLVGTMVQEAFASHPAIRKACHHSIFGHASDVAHDIEAAKEKYVPNAKWSSEGLALHIQSVLQGSFILAKANRGPEVAVENLEHLKAYVEFLFRKSETKETA